MESFLVRRLVFFCKQKNILAGLGMAALLGVGCQHRAEDHELASAGLTATTPASSVLATYDFCQVTGETGDVTSEHPWGAEMVQTAITHLMNEPKIKGTIWEAYPLTYRRMTAARDRARCAGVLMDPDPRFNLINHQLADIMTRWLVLETSQCARKAPDRMPDMGFCGAMKRVKKEKFDGLSASLASTAVYLSSHLAASLTGVIVNDAFWAAFPDPATHRQGGSSLDAVLEARISWMRRYKPTYDRFNAFLAENFKTIADALKEGGLVRGETLHFAIYLSQLMPCRARLLGSIRDRAFQAALAYARDPLLARHPMLKPNNGGYLLNYGQFNDEAPLPQALTDLEKHAMTALVNPLSLKIYRDLLGGVKVQELEYGEPQKCSL